MEVAGSRHHPDSSGVLRSIVEHAPQIITRIDRDLRYAYINPAISRTGRAPRDLVGKRAVEIGVSVEAATTLRQLVAEVFATGEPRRVVQSFRGPSGQRYYRIYYVPERAADGSIAAVLSYADDVTREIQAEAALRFLADAGARLSASLDYPTTLADIAQFAVPTIADWCVVDIADEAGQLDRLAIAHSDPTQVARAWELHRRYPAAVNATEGPRAAFERGQRHYLREIPTEVVTAAAHDPEHRAILQALDLHSYVAIPLRARGRTLGVITFLNGATRPSFAEADLALAEELAQRAALAIDNAQLFSAERDARRVAETASQRAGQLQALTTAFSRALTPGEVAKVVLTRAVPTVGAVAGRVVVRTADGTALTLLGAVGYSDEVLVRWQHIPLDQPVPIAEAVQRGTAIWLSSRSALLARFPHVAHVPGVASRAVAVLPLLVDSRAIGALALSFANERVFSVEEQAFMEALAHVCAQALERARLYEVEQQARLAAEDIASQRAEFLAIASHELKTPLTSIKAIVQLLTRRSAAPLVEADRRVALIQTLSGQVDRLERLVGDLLNATRLQQGQLELRREWIDLADLARTVLGRFTAFQNESPRHRLHLTAPAAVSGMWDSERVDQVLTNLIANAIMYSPDGGDIWVRVHRVGDSAEIQVEDAGIGISSDEQRSLFQPFARGASSVQGLNGTGLGLYITDQIVARHGGTIAVESEPGRGSQFTVRLPVHVGDPESQTVPR